MITPQIIHDIRHPERLTRLMEEVGMQGINDVTIWEATTDLATVEASITKSHKDIIRWAMDRNLEEVAIWEDDVMFQDQNAWRYFLDNKPEKYDLYLAGAYGMSVALDGHLISFQGLHCYLCHKNYYQKFLDSPDDQHIDVAQSGKGNFFVCQPMVAYQRPGYSSTARKFVNYNQ